MLLKDLSINNKGYYGIGASSCSFNCNFPQYLRITDIDDFGFVNNLNCSINPNEYPDYNKYFLSKYDIVFARTGNSAGRNYMYLGDEKKVVFAGFLIKFSIDPDKVNPLYVKYFCQSNKYWNNIQEIFTGSTRPNINEKTFSMLDIPLVSAELQQHIVDIIGSIDDKIENNNKIIEKFNKFLKIKTNELLLYKTTKIQLNDIIEECKEKTDIELTPYSVVNTGKVIIQNEQFNKEIAKNIKGKYKKIKKDFFVYNPSRINIGSIGMMEDKIGCVSPIYIVFKCDVEYKIYLQQLLTFEFMIKEINKRCSGSVRQALPFKDLCSIEIYDIERDKLKLYNKYCENIIKTIKKLEEENLKLQQLKNNYLAKFF